MLVLCLRLAFGDRVLPGSASLIARVKAAVRWIGEPSFSTRSRDTRLRIWFGWDEGMRTSLRSRCMQRRTEPDAFPYDPFSPFHLPAA
jgi:hypothetical protein